MPITNKVARETLLALCKHLKVSEWDVRGSKKNQRIVYWRDQIAFVLAKWITQTEVAMLLGKDASTISQACSRAGSLYATEIQYKIEIDELVKVAAQIVAANGKEVLVGEQPIATIETSAEVIDPPILKLLKMERDECFANAQNSHRRGLLLEQAIAHLEGREGKEITVNRIRADEVVK